MPTVYGRSRRKGPSRAVWIGAMVSLSATAAVVAALGRYERRAILGQVEDWAITGPPCPPLAPGDYARRYGRTERAVEYDGNIYARQVGHVSCRSVADPGGFGFVSHPVCQFTSPLALRIRVGGAESLFEPGPGRQATVGLERGRPRCVLGGNFSVLHDPT
jgi:hypothetical protein